MAGLYKNSVLSLDRDLSCRPHGLNLFVSLTVGIQSLFDTATAGETSQPITAAGKLRSVGIDSLGSGRILLQLRCVSAAKKA